MCKSLFSLIPSCVTVSPPGETSPSYTRLSTSLLCPECLFITPCTVRLPCCLRFRNSGLASFLRSHVSHLSYILYSHFPVRSGLIFPGISDTTHVYTKTSEHVFFTVLSQLQKFTRRLTTHFLPHIHRFAFCWSDPWCVIRSPLRHRSRTLYHHSTFILHLVRPTDLGVIQHDLPCES